jgi:hypothetical protein
MAGVEMFKIVLLLIFWRNTVQKTLSEGKNTTYSSGKICIKIQEAYDNTSHKKLSKTNGTPQLPPNG